MSLSPEEFAKRIIEQAQEEAKKILEDARQKAKKIIEEAKKEAEKVRAQKEFEIKRRIKAEVARRVGTEKRQARLEITSKRRELVDKALEEGAKLARSKLSEEILRRRYEDVIKAFPDVKREKIIAPEYFNIDGLAKEVADIDGFALVSEDREVADTVSRRVESRRKKLEAIAAEELFGRVVRL